MRVYSFFYIMILVSGFFSLAKGQKISPPATFVIKDKGIPFIKNFTTKDYRASFQNWAAVQDNRGVMYFGNNDGILEFDGLNWRLIEIANKSVVRSLTKDDNGRIYVGALSEIGYLAPDSLGKMQYKSLVHLLPEDTRNFNDMWDIYVGSQAIYMISFSGLYIFPKDIDNAKGKIKVIPPSEGRQFHRAYVVRGQVYVREWGKGLMKLGNNRLELVPGGEQFAQERMYSMLPFGNDKILVASRTKGLFLYDGKAFSPWRKDIAPLLTSAEVYNGYLLHNQYYAFATLNSGVVILDLQGNPVQAIDQSKGLVSNSMYCAYLDRHQNLWLGGENGISMLQVGLPVSIFDQRTGVEGGTNDLHLFNDTLYAATNQGLYLKPWKKQENLLNTTARFRLVDNTSGQTWDFLEINKQLHVGHYDGVLRIRNARARQAYQGQSHAMSLVLLENNKALSAGVGGLELLSTRETTWRKIKGFAEYPHTFDQYHHLLQDKEGIFWTSHENVGVYSFRLNTVNDSLTHLTRYKAAQYGLPSDLRIRIYQIDGRVLFATEKGIYTFNKTKNKFEKDVLDHYMPLGKRVFFLTEDPASNIWCQVGDRIGVLQKSGKMYVMNFSHFAPLQGADIYCISPLGDNEVLMGTSEGIIHYSGNLNRRYQNQFDAFLQKVEIETSEGQDSLIFAGLYGHATGLMLTRQPKNEIKIFPFELNSFRFTFNAPYYIQSNAIEYSYYLENFDKKWSKWGNYKKKGYTNLPEGTYTFHLKARNVYGAITKEATYCFVISPPWYRTWWAYLGYVLSLLLLVVSAVKFYTFRLRHQKVKLEEAVTARTTEVMAQKEEIRQQQEELQAQHTYLEEAYQNVQLLTSIGQEITASLDLDMVLNAIYEHVNQLIDATNFGIGIYEPQNQRITFRLTIEKGARNKPYTRSMENKNQLAVWSVEHGKPIRIGNMPNEYQQYIETYEKTALLPGDSSHEIPLSVMYVPLVVQSKVVGTIGVHSPRKNAYTDYHFNLLNNMSMYVAIAIDNAQVYLQLDKKNKNITASITYAQRIQEAILPFSKHMHAHLPNHFVLFRPRDIVSGDFYWFETIENKIFVVAADCTGHGVPGAFMTMLGAEALTNIVVHNKIHAPNQILLALDTMLSEILKSKDTMVRDGMDLALTVIDTSKKELQYAGAKNPLLLVQNNEIKEIKGDIYGINGQRKPNHKMAFTTHTIDISIPTAFYLYSDGYQDQFGGERGKKFMKKRLRELLFGIYDQPMETQKQTLEATLDEWAGGREQIDDILVMGVQL